MFFILLIGSSLYLFWVSLFMKKRSDLDHKNFATMAVYQSDIIELIEVNCSYWKRFYSF